MMKKALMIILLVLLGTFCFSQTQNYVFKKLDILEGGKNIETKPNQDFWVVIRWIGTIHDYSFDCQHFCLTLCFWLRSEGQSILIFTFMESASST